MKTQIFLMYIVTILLLTFQLFPDLFVRIKPLLLNETGDVMVNGKVTNKTDITRVVWQTLRRSTYEILGVKLLMKGYIWYRFHCLQKKLWSKFCRKNLEGTYQVVGRISNILKTKEMFFQQIKMLVNSF